MIGLIRRTVDLDAEMGNLRVELAHRERLVPLSSAVGELYVGDWPEVANNLARSIVDELDIAPPRKPVDDIGRAMGRGFTIHTHPHLL